MNTNKHKNSVLTALPVNDLEKKFKEWENMLNGEDEPLSIRNQIRIMISNCAILLIINESRKLAPKDAEENIKQNGMLQRFIDDLFFESQLLSIRRLTDTDFDRVKKNKEYTVYSLYNLIEDIKKNKNLLTRKNILTFQKWPYDYDDTQLIGVSGQSQWVHKTIDDMMEITPDKRKPEDRIPDKIFDNLIEKMESIKKLGLKEYVDKYIAHAATAESRKEVPGIVDNALGKIREAHKIICETAGYIETHLLFRTRGNFMPVFMFDKFIYLDEPMASKETIKKLEISWSNYYNEVGQWCKC